MSLRAEEWDEVWHEYDARQRGMPAFPHALPRPEVAAARERRGRSVLGALTLVAALLLAAGAWAAAPGAAAREIIGAVRAADPVALSQRVDWPALRGAVPEAEGYLGALAAAVAAGQATPGGLLALLQSRGGLLDPVLRLGGPGGVALAFPGLAPEGVTLHLAPRGALPPRWMVVGVDAG